MKNFPIKISLSYFAGFMDGEGTITIDKMVRKNKHNNFSMFRPAIHLTNTNFDIIHKINKQYGGYLIHRTKIAKCKPFIDVRWESKEAIKLVKKLLPYLILKKKQALLLIKYGNFKNNLHCRKRNFKDYTKEINLVNKMRLLNKRGKI